LLICYRLLLKYVSRDKLDLLGQGTGGIVEVRMTIAGYEDVSPLYGFMRYRNRSIIVKYLPDECGSLARGEFFNRHTHNCQSNKQKTESLGR
jgi:hypothetical protein